MSYIPPLGNLADLRFGTGYTAPLGNAANLSFSTSAANSATGFLATQFGNPGTPLPVTGLYSTLFGTPTNALGEPATGFSSTTFGSPKALGYEQSIGWISTTFGTPGVSLSVLASGWQATVFGGASTPLPAYGFLPSVFGTPEGHNHFNAKTIGRVTQWNYPYVAYVAHPLILAAEGLMATKVGFPQRVSRPFTPENTFTAAAGFKTTVFSTVSSASPATTQAGGTTTTAFGTPTTDKTFAVTGVSSSLQFGQVTSSFNTRASGFKTVALATPTNRRTQLAASTYRATRWGTPTSERSNAFKTYSINVSGRFGQPRSTLRFNYPATGIHTSQLGTHTSFETRHVTMIPPTQQFGKPLLKRTPLC